ncbi:MAG: hypothetical protein RR128_00490 [Clostridium sp.]
MKVIQMSENFKRPRRHKSTSKAVFILPVICVLFLSAAMWTNSIAKNYNSKISDLEAKINAAKTETTEIESKISELKSSITELDSQIEEITTELN